jgi:hypothetical protein
VSAAELSHGLRNCSSLSASGALTVLQSYSHNLCVPAIDCRALARSGQMAP